MLSNSSRLKRRGPDHTEICSINGQTIIHNLLSLNGVYTPQPVFLEHKNAYLFFNGEIYNDEIYSYYSGSDTAFLAGLFDSCPDEEVAFQLDGEFLICLYFATHHQLLVCSDLFGTKPAWFGFSSTSGDWAISSYSSTLCELGMDHYVQIPPNRFIRFDLASRSIISCSPIHVNLVPNDESSFAKWCANFDQAIIKRKPAVGHLVIPLSSGMDSGLIAYRANELGMNPLFLSIPGCEDHEIMLRRQEQLGVEFLALTRAEFLLAHEAILLQVENFNYRRHQPLLDIDCLFDDPGTVGIFALLRYAKQFGCKVSFSGQGADEIYSDYGFQGKPLANVSSFAGKYPDDIRDIFPWKNLFSGTQRAYLMKDEHVAGSLGMESRYPFLDIQLFRSFLALPASIKNATYKGPVGRWIEELRIPVASSKLGFSANRGLIA